MKRILCLCFVFWFIHCATSDSVSIDGLYAPMRIIQGNKLILVCRFQGTTTGGALEFYYQYNANDPRKKLESDASKGLTIVSSPGITTLTKDTTELEDGGSYICLHTTANKSFQVDVQIIRVSGGDETLPVPATSTAVLSCIPEFNKTSNNDTYETVWTKNDTALGSSKYTMNKTHLAIQNPDRSTDLGVYNCILTFTLDRNKVNATVSLFSAPYIDTEHAAKSKNFMKGEDMTYDCPVTGFPMPVVKWFKDGNELDVTNQNDRYSFKDTDGAKHGRITIYSLVFEDKGTYKCVGESTMFNSTEIAILIRVKDKLEPLWPFLGIVAEVIVLVIIIFIAEKRKRSKEDSIDSADGATVPMANATYHGGDDVRHRNVNT